MVLEPSFNGFLNPSHNYFYNGPWDKTIFPKLCCTVESTREHKNLLASTPQALWQSLWPGFQEF